jgi:hypothetical protein
VIELDPDDNSWRHHGELGDDDPDTQPLSTRLLHHLQQRSGTFFEPDELVLEFPNTNRDQIRKALERWRKQGVLKAEERVKPTPTGKTRYKVYAADLPKAVSSEGQTQSQTAIGSLDTPSEALERVQRAQAPPRLDPSSLDAPHQRDAYHPRRPF